MMPLGRETDLYASADHTDHDTSSSNDPHEIDKSEENVLIIPTRHTNYEVEMPISPSNSLPPELQYLFLHCDYSLNHAKR